MQQPNVYAPAFTINPVARLKLVALDPKETLVITAQFNPKEIQIDSSATWAPHRHKGGRPTDLEFTGRNPRTVTLELMFDASEVAEGSLREPLEALDKLLQNVSETGDLRRPPAVRVVWGAGTKGGDLPDFSAVVESISVKHTMFGADGRCLRAIANVKLKEATFARSR